MSEEEMKINGLVVRVCEDHPNYAISACGKVFRISSGKVMAQMLQGIPNYWYTRCSQKGVAKNVRVHRLLAQAWVHNDDPVNKKTVNHINGEKLGNTLSNLEWVTLARNNQHGTFLEGNSGEGLYNASLNDQLAHTLCQRLVDGSRAIDLAKEYGISKDVVNKLKTGSTWFHVRKLYEIPHTFKTEYSPSTVHWVCEQINAGVGDINIAKNSSNTQLTPIDVKRIRHKIRYVSITDMYF